MISTTLASLELDFMNFEVHFLFYQVDTRCYIHENC